MSKNAKIVIAVVLVVLVIIICCFTLGKNKEKQDDNVGTENLITNEVVENEDENVVNEIESNTVENEVVEEEIIENVTEVKPQGTVYESNSNAGTTDKKQDAIALVKEKWGEDSTVTFRCDSVSSNEEYIIAVVSKETATVKNYFRVNLATKTVEVDY